MARVRSGASGTFELADVLTLRLFIVSDRTILDGRVLHEDPVEDPLADARVVADSERARIQFGDDPGDFVLMRRIDGIDTLVLN
jgi:hypothetical protein